MQSEFVPFAAEARVRLLVDVEGLKKIDKIWKPHTLPAGSLAFIKGHVDPRASINTNPLSAENYLYQLRGTITESVTEENLEEGLCKAYREDQRIHHLCLDTKGYPPGGKNGMYQLGAKTRIIPGHEYKYGREPNTTTLTSSDLIAIEQLATTKSGHPVLLIKNAYYLVVRKVIYSTVQKERTWRSEIAVGSSKFEVVQD